MILVTGATGNLGTSVIAQLQQHINTSEFIASSSNAKGVAKLEKQGLQAGLADFNDMQSLNAALKGITKVLLISTMEQNRFEQHKNLVDAAKNNGVKHILYTSLAIANIETSGVKDLMMSHFQTEDYIKASGLDYTILRNGMYADALGQILGENGAKQDINLPGGKGKVPYALRSEMGEGIANLLVQNGHENKIYNIVGSQAYSYADIAKAFSELSGANLKYNDISAADFVQSLKNIGFPDFAIYLHAGTIEDIKNHQYEIKDNTLATLLGRPTASLKEFLKVVFHL